MDAGHVPVAAAIAIAYLAGSIPSAYLAGRSRGIDLRQHGSGNLGATNVVRVLGPRIGAVVFIADTLKGLLPVVLLPPRTTTVHPELLALSLAGAAVLGHVRPIFLLWRGGGKGVATAGGAFLGLVPGAVAATMAVWLAVFAVSRYVSLASVLAALTLPVAVALTGRPANDPLFIASVVAAVFVCYTHRANLRRLRRGEEHRFRRARSAVPGVRP